MNLVGNLEYTIPSFDFKMFKNPNRMYKVIKVNEGQYLCNTYCPAYSVCRFRNQFAVGRDRIVLNNNLTYCEADLIKVKKTFR